MGGWAPLVSAVESPKVQRAVKMMYCSCQAASTLSWALALWRNRDPSGDGAGRNGAMRKRGDVFDEVRTFQHEKEL